VKVRFGPENLELLADRAVLWPARNTLVVADVHLGKAATFRHAGVPVPEACTDRDLARLTALIQKTSATRLVILGDFFHARSGRQPEVFDAISRWRIAHDQLQIILVRGNHDRMSGRVPTEWKLDEVDAPFEDNGIIYSHFPCEDSNSPMLAGHVHPVFHLEDYDGSIVRAPCFVFDEKCAVLPSFGSFTGGKAIALKPNRRVFIAAGRVIEVSQTSSKPRR